MTDVVLAFLMILGKGQIVSSQAYCIFVYVTVNLTFGIIVKQANVLKSVIL